MKEFPSLHQIPSYTIGMSRKFVKSVLGNNNVKCLTILYALPPPGSGHLVSTHI